jgi:ATP-dependent RNA helicase DDX55/SPB4
LAKQLDAVLEQLLLGSQDSTITHMVLTGGRPVHDDIVEFRQNGADIIIATPGKLQDMLDKCTELSTKELDVFILDEADRLLDMGFEKSLRKIIARLPKQRRTGLFSATMTDALGELVKAGLRNPVRVVVKVEDLVTRQVQRTPSSLAISYLLCESDEKFELLVRYLLDWQSQKGIVYFNTCHEVDYFFKVCFSFAVEFNGRFYHCCRY